MNTNEFFLKSYIYFKNKIFENGKKQKNPGVKLTTAFKIMVVKTKFIVAKYD